MWVHYLLEILLDGAGRTPVVIVLNIMVGFRGGMRARVRLKYRVSIILTAAKVAKELCRLAFIAFLSASFAMFAL